MNGMTSKTGKTNQKGVTLVEIIVALAILGIISVTFLTIFAGTFKWVIDGGDRGEAVFSAQQAVESNLVDSSTGSPVTVVIRKQDGSSITVAGKLVEPSGLAAGSVGEDIRTFVPNK